VAKEVGVEVVGLNKLLRALESLDSEAKAHFRSVGKWAGNVVADEARIRVPVRSGNLRQSISPVATGRGARVRAGGGRLGVLYAGPIHFGWFRRGILPTPFLYQAADARIDEVVDQYLAQVYAVWNRNL